MRFNFVLIAILFVLSSCYKDTFPEQMHDSAKKPEILSKLEIFNDSLLTSKAENHVTRGRVYNFARFITVALSDFRGAKDGGSLGAKVGTFLGGPHGTTVGAAIGGLVGGAAYSYVAYNKTKPAHLKTATLSFTPQMVLQAYGCTFDKGLKTDEFLPNKIRIAWPQQVGDPLLGAKHNMVLRCMLDNEYSAFPIEHYLTSEEFAIINSPDYVSWLDDAIERLQMNEVEEERDKASIADAVMSLYEKFCREYVESDYDIEYVTNKYVEMVDACDDISEEDKMMIYSAFSVAVSSFEFWEEEMQTE